MYTYNLFQWIFFFFIYCFFGWCIESTIVSVQKHHFVNRGFLRVPMLPLYGSGAVLILCITFPVKNNFLLIYIFGLIGATILEYITGWTMESLFKVKYWDYSNQKLQLKGRICLSSSLFWGFLSIALTKFIHLPIERFVLHLNSNFLIASVIVIGLVMLFDTIVSARAALDLAKLLERLSIAREEIDYILEQLEDFKDIAQIQLEEFKENTQMQITALKENTQLQFNNLKEAALKQKQEKIDLLKNRLTELTQQRKNEFKKLGFFKSQLIKGHPSSHSKRFNTSLKELKEHLNQKWQKKKD